MIAPNHPLPSLNLVCIRQWIGFGIFFPGVFLFLGSHGFTINQPYWTFLPADPPLGWPCCKVRRVERFFRFSVGLPTCPLCRIGSAFCTPNTQLSAPCSLGVQCPIKCASHRTSARSPLSVPVYTWLGGGASVWATPRHRHLPHILLPIGGGPHPCLGWRN